MPGPGSGSVPGPPAARVQLKVLADARARELARPHQITTIRAARCAIGLAEARGWSAATVAGVFYGLKTVLDGHTGELPAGFGRDVRAWLVVLLDGDARTRPRSHATVHFHFGRVRPFIECWAATRGHLREITSGDVDAVLEPLRGHRRYNAITALRSLFRFAKRAA